MSKKVFQWANELGERPLDLVEKLKGIGLNVRNHMHSLTDEEMAKATTELGLGAAPETAKTTKKKKVVKKKTAKKKVVKKVFKKAAVADESTETLEAKQETQAEETATETSSKKVVRRKVVRRKSSSDKPSGEEAVSANSESADEAPVKDVLARDHGLKKLEVVSAPEVVAAPTAVEESSQEIDKKKEIFKEKMHTFTPVFVPENKKEEQQTKTSAKKEFDINDQVADDESKGEKAGKKKLGGLAAMMSKPKTSNKSRDLTEMRAQEEMKSYGSGMLGGYYVPAKKKKLYSGPSKETMITEVKGAKRVVQVHGGATALDLAKKLSITFEEMKNKSLELNLLLRGDDFLGMSLCTELSALWDYRVEDREFNENEIIGTEVKAEDSLPLRDPIITVMGHVDHGKTTLLDHIRSAKVADGEAGGITQHIGAYSVKVKGSNITFLDTPGHAAFANMRQRGADITDIVILVVAADDGVMPQTKESIKFCQRANKPLIVAVNKMDKEGANPDRIKQELTEFEITPEEWGGDTQFVPISALRGEGIDELLEAVQLQSEMMELKADAKGKAEGVIIESRVETGRGPVATVLVQKGTLKKGDSIVVGESFGRARSMMSYSGEDVKAVGPSIPVQILGLSDAPSPGDTLNVVKNEREAKKIVANREAKRKEIEATSRASVNSLEDFFADVVAGEKKELSLIVRSDVQGSYEAIKNALESLGNDEVGVKVIAGGVGAITDNDVLLAESTKGYILGFNMRPVTSARRLSEQKGVEVKTYSIIYELIDDIKAALEGMLEPERVEVYLGRAEVKDTFSVPKIGTIAGSEVIDGKIKKGCCIRLLREGKILFDGNMSSLKRFKDDVKEVVTGLECGIGLENFNDIKINDLFEAYFFEEKKRTLETELTL